MIKGNRTPAREGGCLRSAEDSARPSGNGAGVRRGLRGRGALRRGSSTCKGPGPAEDTGLPRGRGEQGPHRAGWPDEGRGAEPSEARTGLCRLGWGCGPPEGARCRRY